MPKESQGTYYSTAQGAICCRRSAALNDPIVRRRPPTDSCPRRTTDPDLPLHPSERPRRQSRPESFPTRQNTPTAVTRTTVASDAAAGGEAHAHACLIVRWHLDDRLALGAGLPSPRADRVCVSVCASARLRGHWAGMPMYGREIDECGEPAGYGHLRHICTTRDPRAPEPP